MNQKWWIYLSKVSPYCLRRIWSSTNFAFLWKNLCHQVPGQPLPFTMSQTYVSMTMSQEKFKASKTSFQHNNNHQWWLLLLATPVLLRFWQRSSANSVKKYQKPLKCLWCGRNHKLISCRKATDQEKKELWEAYKKTWTTNWTCKSTPPTNQANHTE